MDNKTRVNNATIAYYGMGDTTMTDSEYDNLFTEVYGDTTTPLDLYKSLFVDDGRKRNLAIPMLSLSKAKQSGEVDKWVTKVLNHNPNATISLAPKYDGLACLVEVHDGEVVSATTRGNGTVGEDVTYAVQHITEGAITEDGYHQVEVCMSFEAMEQANKWRESTGADPYKHPRNAAAGILRLSNSDILHLVGFLSLHRHFHPVQYGFSEQITAGHPNAERDAGELMDDYRAELLRRMDDQNVAVLTDGVVLYAHDTDGNPLRDMGDDGSHPYWAVAWKFVNEPKVATLKSIHWQTGRTKNTPVATFNPPVDFDGTMVTKASLANAAKIDKLGIQIGDQVNLIRSGEVIPDVKGLHAKGANRTPAPEEPDMEITTAMFLSLIVNVMDIRGLGSGRVDTLADWMDHNRAIRDDRLSEDILTSLAVIGDSPDLIEGLDRFGVKSAAAVASSIRDRLGKATMVQWFACLGIPGIGRRVWASVFDTLGGARQVITALESGDVKVPGIGPKRVALMMENLPQIRDLVTMIVTECGEITGLDEQPEHTSDDAEPSSGVAVVTGKIDGVTRSGIQEALTGAGWSMGSSVKSGTTVLFNASGRESSKTKNATKHNVPVVTVSQDNGLAEILDWIDQHSE